jgi:hypothetical protein
VDTTPSPDLSERTGYRSKSSRKFGAGFFGMDQSDRYTPPLIRSASTPRKGILSFPLLSVEVFNVGCAYPKAVLTEKPLLSISV